VADPVLTQVTIDVQDVHGLLYRRWDGCVALPQGYRGPARTAIFGG
jgi:hypothetical protein